jgi:hypothetical protein
MSEGVCLLIEDGMDDRDMVFVDLRTLSIDGIWTVFETRMSRSVLGFCTPTLEIGNTHHHHWSVRFEQALAYLVLQCGRLTASDHSGDSRMVTAKSVSVDC